jgi:hypothetical protein
MSWPAFAAAAPGSSSSRGSCGGRSPLLLLLVLAAAVFFLAAVPVSASATAALARSGEQHGYESEHESGYEHEQEHESESEEHHSNGFEEYSEYEMDHNTSADTDADSTTTHHAESEETAPRAHHSAYSDYYTRQHAQQGAQAHAQADTAHRQASNAHHYEPTHAPASHYVPQHPPAHHAAVAVHHEQQHHRGSVPVHAPSAGHASPFAHDSPSEVPAHHASAHPPAHPQEAPRHRQNRRSSFADHPVSAIETMQAATSDSHRYRPPAANVRVHQPEHFRTLSVKLVDSPLVDMKWSIKKRGGLFTQHVVFALSAHGVVYRSPDGGHTWESQADHMAHTRVLSIHVSRADASYLAFRGAHGLHWYTADAGGSYHTHKDIIYLHNHPAGQSDSPFFGGTSIDPLSMLSDVVAGINASLRPDGEEATPGPDEVRPEHVAEIVNTMHVSEFKLHPTRPTWMLAGVHSRGCLRGAVPNPSATEAAEEAKFGETDSKRLCYQRLLLSLDNGYHWKQILSHVVQFDWGVAPGTAHGHADEKLIYVTGYLENDVQPVTTAWDSNIHFMESRDFFVDAELLIAHGNRFFTGHGYLFVAADDVVSETVNDVALFIRAPGATTFERAHIPVEGLDQFSYTILDTSEHQAFLHINHAPLNAKSISGHLYVSETNGTTFSLSLMNIQRSPEGHCAFAKVEALEGIFLANFVPTEDLTESLGSSLGAGMGDGGEAADVYGSAHGRKRAPSVATPRAVTAISFNKGAEWFFLQPPRKDSRGEDIVCLPDGDGRPCHLHLHGLAQDEFGPFYSDERAPGLVLATGSVGHYVHQHRGGVNTYLSRDGGYSWFEVFKGSHVYELGDHGGLIVMADDTAPTQWLYFSWDEGATWEGVQMTSLPFVVDNIVTEPDNTNVQFIVYGYMPETANQHVPGEEHAAAARQHHGQAGSSSDAGVVAFVDFSDLHTRVCVGAATPGASGSDYEFWTPHDDRMEGQCLMGRRMSLVRRKQHAACFNPVERMPVHEVSRCACTVSDYQCDYGYARKIESGRCERDPSDARYQSLESIVAGKDCKDTYRATKGYRRVPGNVCVGGAEWEPTIRPCPGRIRLGMVLFIIALIAAAGYGLVHYHQRHDLAALLLDLYDRVYGNKAYTLVRTVDAADDDEDLEAVDVGPSYFDGAALASSSSSSAAKPAAAGGAPSKRMGGFHAASAADETTDGDLDADPAAGSSVSASAAKALQSAATTARGLGVAVASKISAATGISIGGVRGSNTGGGSYSALPDASSSSAAAAAAAAAGSAGAQRSAVKFQGRFGDEDTDDDPLAAGSTTAPAAAGARATAPSHAAGSFTAGDDSSSGAEHISLRRPDSPEAPAPAPAPVAAFSPLPASTPAAASELSAFAAAAIPLPPRGNDDDDARTKAAFDLLDQ